MFNTDVNVLQIFIMTVLVFSILIIFPFFSYMKINKRVYDKKQKIFRIILYIVIPELIIFSIGIYAIYYVVKINLL